MSMIMNLKMKISRCLIYFKLELKRTLKLIPNLLAGAIALSIVIGAVAFCAGKILASSNKLNDKKTIAFSSADDSDLVEIIVSSLSKSKSITTLFNIIEADYEDVESMAEKNEAVVSVVIPPRFMYSLITGANYPIELYFSKTASIYSLVIAELGRAAQTALKAAQAGVYTLYDYYEEQNLLKYAPDANTELNIIYLKKALLRENMFSPTVLNATGSLDIKTFYISSGIILIILLLGCVFILHTKDTNTIIAVKLRQNGIGAISQSLVHIFCITASFYALFTGILLIAFLINQFTHLGLTFNLPTMMLNGLALCFCSACIITFISSIVQNRFSAILLLFISVITSCFISGAFLPSAFLPEILTVIGEYLPTTYLLNTTGMMLGGNVYMKGLLKLLCFSAGFVALTIIFTFNSLRNPCKKRSYKG